LDAGTLPKNPPSTVVSTLFNQPQIIRQGEIKISEKSGQIFISNSEKETQKIASQILSSHISHITYRPLIFALQGELGSGKTQFAKGIGKALGIKSNISSPTFTLIREYSIKKRLSSHLAIQPFSNSYFYHLDTWRLQEEKELLEIGFEKMLKPGNIIAIEWAQKAKSLLEKLAKQNKALIVWVNIETLSPTKRKIIYG